MRKDTIVGLAVGGLSAICAVVAARTARYEAHQVEVEPADDRDVALDGAAQRFARGLTFSTISYQDPNDLPGDQFDAFNEYLVRTYPRVHATLKREVVGGYSLLYTWEGSDRSLPAVLIMGHHDVVPVLPGTESDWTHPPFGGVIDDGFIWGRGALDNKAPVFGSLEALEALISTGFQPKRSIILAFGHDEEMGGMQGASQMAELLKSRGTSLEFVLDEGGDISEGVLQGVNGQIATVGIAEKGYLSVRLTVKSPGGHAAMPPNETAVGILAAAISRLERNQMPVSITRAVRLMLDAIGPSQNSIKRTALANLWLSGPLVRWYLARTPATNAMVRTTTAPTMLSGSIKDNILPIEASAIINFRILPGDSISSVMDHIVTTVADARVAATAIDYPTEPSGVSSAESPAYRLIEREVRRLYPGTLVTPYLVVGQTDSRHYAPISRDVYRFLPTRSTPADANRVHGTDERIPVADYLRLIRFVSELVRESAG